MPSKKSQRVAERRRSTNASLRTRAKSSVTKARRLVAAGELEPAKQAVSDMVVALDKAAQKGAIHRNNAARRKSRITKLLP